MPSGSLLGEISYQFKIEHKKGADNILTDALSRLNLPNCDEEDMTYAEKIINSVGLQFNSIRKLKSWRSMK